MRFNFFLCRGDTLADENTKLTFFTWQFITPESMLIACCWHFMVILSITIFFSSHYCPYSYIFLLKLHGQNPKYSKVQSWQHHSRYTHSHIQVNAFKNIYILANGLTMLSRPEYLKNASANLWDGKMLYTKSYYWTVGCFCLNVGSVALAGSYPIVWNAASSSVQRFLLLSAPCRDCATMYQLSRNATAISLLLYGYGNYDRCHWYYFLKPNLLLYCWQRWPMTLRVAWQGLQVWNRYAGR